MSPGTRYPGSAPRRPQQMTGRGGDGHLGTADVRQDDRPPSVYNFVPLSAFVHLPDWADEVSHDAPFEDGYCGEIEYALTAKTPILVSRPTKMGEVKQFDVRPDERGRTRAIIPGSSLRGMLRSVLEIASFGKFQRVTNRALSLRDITGGGHVRGLYGERLTETVAPGVYRARSRGGWLRFEGDRWLLRPCEIARVEQEEELATALKIDRFRQTYRDKKGREQKENLTACQAYQLWLGSHDSLAISFIIENDVERDWDHSFDPSLGRPKQLRYKKAIRLNDPANPQDCERGTLVLTGSVGKKHMEFIFYTPRGEDERTDIEVPAEVMRAFVQVHSGAGEGKGQDGTSPPNRTLESLRKVFEGHSRGIPVFYLSEHDESAGKPIAIGLSQMFRLAYEQTIHEAIAAVNPAHLGAQPDLAELIFGRVPGRHAKSTDRALRGRVSFDTLLEQAVGGQYKQAITCDRTILAAPRPSFFPYYVEQPGASSDRLAQVTTKGGTLFPPRGDRPLEAYSSLSSQPAASAPNAPSDHTVPASHPRGWKRYPVRAVVGPNPVPEEQRRMDRELTNEDIKVTLRPLPGGAQFTGRVRFHNLKEVELSALLWAMTWGGHEDYWHSLGMGKPFGWGGCTIEVTSVRARRNDAEREEFSVFKDELEPDSQLRQTFAEHMEEAYQTWNASDSEGAECEAATWADSEQLRELLAMADPEMAMDARLPQQLRHPWAVPGGVKAFANLKEAGKVLPRYGGHRCPRGSREDRERRRRFAPSPSSGGVRQARPAAAVDGSVGASTRRTELDEAGEIAYRVKGVVETPEVVAVLEAHPGRAARWVRNAIVTVLNAANQNGGNWYETIRGEPLATLVEGIGDEAKRREIAGLVLAAWDALGFLRPDARLSKKSSHALATYQRIVQAPREAT